MTAVLNSFCELIVDTKHKTPLFQEGGYPCVRTPNIGKGYFVFKNVKRVSEKTYHEWIDRACPQEGDLILTREAPVGNVAIIKQGIKVCHGQRTVLIRPNRERIDPRYLMYLMLGNEIQNRMFSLSNGATVPHLNMSDICSLELPEIPKKVNQKKIAFILSAYDDLIENNARRISILEEMAQMIYREWFVKFRFPGHEHVKIIDGVPDGWIYKCLIDIADLTMGQSPKSEFYNVDGNGLPFHQGVKKFGERFVHHETYCTKSTRLAEPGDILFSVRAPVGRLNITLDYIILGRGLAAIKSKKGQQSFLFYQLKSHFFKEDMIGGGAIYASVKKGDLEDEEMLMPSKLLTKEFNQFSSIIDEQIKSLHLINKRLMKSRDLLLPKLISGKLDVADLDIEIPETEEPELQASAGGMK